MTKSELIEAVANKLKLPKGKAELIVNCVFDSMEGALRRGERIEIRGFGSFEIRNYKSYEGRNPRTGTKVDVRPKRLPFFKVGKELKERVNNGIEGSAPGLIEAAKDTSVTRGEEASAASPAPATTPTTP
jgi:integration host factor subunit beta